MGLAQRNLKFPILKDPYDFLSLGGGGGGAA